MIVSRVTFLVIVAAGLLLLLTTWFIVDRVVARPLRDVVRGAQRVAEFLVSLCQLEGGHCRVGM